MKKKNIQIILIAFCLYAIGDGFAYNFQELWLQGNDITAKSIGVIFSLCALLTISTIFLCSSFIRKEKLKKFTTTLIISKAAILLVLFSLYKSGLNVAIKFLTMCDYVIDVEVLACVYPLLSLIDKNDKLYAKKDLLISGSKIVGILITSFLLGKSFLKLKIDYNNYFLVSAVLTFSSYFVLKRLNFKTADFTVSQDNNILYELLAKLKKDNISKIYLTSIVFNEISYCSLFGLKLLLLTNNFSYSPAEASLIVTFLSIASVIMGALVLAKLTFKNDYLNLSIKFVIRLLLYTLAVITNSMPLFFIAFVYAKITSDSYSHVSDAPYINRFNKDYQFAFGNLRTMVVYLGIAIGTYICGIAIVKGLRFNYIFAAIFCLIEIILRFIALHLKNKEANKITT